MANPAALSDIELAVLTMALATDELTPTLSDVVVDRNGKTIERSDDALADLIIATASGWHRTPEVRARVLQKLARECARRPRSIKEMKAARAALHAVCHGHPPQGSES